MDNNIKALAEKLFKSIKNILSDARKHNRENDNFYNRHRQYVNIDIDCISDNYEISVDGNEICQCKYRFDVSDVFKELCLLLNAQKKVKGWSGLNFAKEEVRLGNTGLYGSSTTVIKKVCLADAPCSEYKSLMNYINKFGKNEYGSSMKLGNFELFCAAKGGKRGHLWDEYGERLFLDNKPKKCTLFLSQIRKARGTNDSMICKIGEEDYIDPAELQHSIYAEVECDGEHRRYLHITIKTPTGRVKYDNKIY